MTDHTLRKTLRDVFAERHAEFERKAALRDTASKELRELAQDVRDFDGNATISARELTVSRGIKSIKIMPQLNEDSSGLVYEVEYEIGSKRSLSYDQMLVELAEFIRPNQVLDW